MKIYRYAKKQYIKLNDYELQHFKENLISASVKGSWGYMKSPINGIPLEIEKLQFNKCIGCSWLQVLILHTNNNYGAKWGFNTYLKQAR